MATSKLVISQTGNWKSFFSLSLFMVCLLDYTISSVKSGTLSVLFIFHPQCLTLCPAHGRSSTSNVCSMEKWRTGNQKTWAVWSWASSFLSPSLSFLTVWCCCMFLFVYLPPLECRCHEIKSLTCQRAWHIIGSLLIFVEQTNGWLNDWISKRRRLASEIWWQGFLGTYPFPYLNGGLSGLVLCTPKRA